MDKGKRSGKGTTSSSSSSKGGCKVPNEPPTAAPTAAPTGFPATMPQERPDAFDITLINMGGPSKFDDAFQFAARHWEAIINGEQSNVAPASTFGIGDWFDGVFDESFAEAIDDIAIGYALDDLPVVLSFNV